MILVVSELHALLYDTVNKTIIYQVISLTWRVIKRWQDVNIKVNDTKQQKSVICISYLYLNLTTPTFKVHIAGQFTID